MQVIPYRSFNKIVTFIDSSYEVLSDNLAKEWKGLID